MAPRNCVKGNPSDTRIGTTLVAADIGTLVPAVPYWYLAGPMTGKPQFNFPEFIRVTALLRAAGYVICPPHEMDKSLSVYEEALACPDGSTPHLDSQGTLGLDLLRRDANIVMHPNCQGTIALPGWQESFGAGQIEVYLADRFKKETLTFIEDSDTTHGWYLMPITYDVQMARWTAEQDDIADARKRIAETIEPPVSCAEPNLSSLGKLERTRDELARIGAGDLGTL